MWSYTKPLNRHWTEYQSFVSIAISLMGLSESILNMTIDFNIEHSEAWSWSSASLVVELWLHLFFFRPSCTMRATWMMGWRCRALSTRRVALPESSAALYFSSIGSSGNSFIQGLWNEEIFLGWFASDKRIQTWIFFSARPVRRSSGNL